MKMKAKLLTVLSVVLALSFSACKKDDKKTSATDFLTSGNWKIVSDQEKIGPADWVEYIGNYDACELDNFYKFNTDNTGVYDEGATKCDPGDLQTFPITWELLNSGTQLKISYGLYSDTAALVSVNATNLVIQSSDEDNGVVTLNKMTFAH